MHGLVARNLLRLFEAGRGRNPLEQGLLLLRQAWPEAGTDLCRELPMAERDRLLVALRRATFGSTARIAAVCPECGTELETPFDLDRLLATPAPDPFAVHPVTVDGRELRFRLPSTADLEAVLGLAPEQARRRLVERTLVDGDPVDGDQSPAVSEATVAAVTAAWEAADPLVEVLLTLDCVDCGASFEEVFDVVTFFTAEIEACAKRLLLDIHTLASAYGWTEPEILAVGPERRRLYVEMAS
jgi:hypothetical protein